MRKAAWILSCCLLILFAVSLTCYAGETEVITEGVYVAGDRDAPRDAEEAALMAAKREALEQFGTFVQSSTSVKNFTLRDDQINSLAAGLMKVTVLERNRSIEGKSFVFRVKIKAVASAEKVQESIAKLQAQAQNPSGQPGAAPVVRNTISLGIIEVVDRSLPGINNLDQLGYSPYATAQFAHDYGLSGKIREILRNRYSSAMVAVDFDNVGQIDNIAQYAAQRNYDYLMTVKIKIKNLKIQQPDPTDSLLTGIFTLGLISQSAEYLMEVECTVDCYDKKEQRIKFSKTFAQGRSYSDEQGMASSQVIASLSSQIVQALMSEIPNATPSIL